MEQLTNPTKGYVAFLRGINVGGNNMVKMETLKTAFESMGFQQVKTILASGNVLFETATTDNDTLSKRIGDTLEKTVGFAISVIVHSIEEIEHLADTDPFRGIAVTPQTRLYVTFLSEKPKSTLKIPYLSPEKDFNILQVSDSEVCSVLTVSKERGTVDAMKILEKEFGRNITTRNWNTIRKILTTS